ncbi:MAG: hypothetical protein HY873_13110 [Chloroflexi bacterium]|nr:hypothetical protein [Chloroflexota bacterium]
MPISTVTVNAYADWNGDADFADANEDISAYLQRVDVRRGRASVNDEFSAGTMTIEVDNQSGLFSPFNASSAIYGSMLPGRAIKVEAVHLAVTYPVFYGYITDYQQSRSPSGRPSVVITALDAFDVLRFGSIRTALQESKRVDQLITACLDAGGWSASLRDLDTAEVTVTTAWWHDTDTLTAIRSAAKQNLGGQLFISRDGKVTWRNRYARSAAAVHATLTGPQGLGFGIRRDDFISDVHHTRGGIDIASANSVLYSHTPTGRRLQPGSTDPENTIYLDFAAGGKSVVTPLATTDYLANAQADGGGADKTAQVTVSSFTAYGGGAVITFANADSAPVYLYHTASAAFQVRGLAVTQQSDKRRIEVAAASPIVDNQVFSDAFDYYDDATDIEAFAHYRLNVFNAIQPRMGVDLTPRSDAEMAVVLGGELGKRITLQNTTGLYPTQVSGDFFTEAISLSLSPGLQVGCRWELFHEDQAMGAFFRISGAAGGGQDYSQIATAAPVTGDRIAF